MTHGLEARRWNEAYKNNKYFGEEPIDFTTNIIDNLGEDVRGQYGLYVGCGNGRNYIPLLDAGLNLHGIDISAVAIEQLKKRVPEAPVSTLDIKNLHQSGVWDYVIAIQVFQHGNKKTVNDNFAKTQQILKPEGKLFLRVNSINTEPYYENTKIEGTRRDGCTIRYQDGPKKGMDIHFFSERELGSIANRHLFNVLVPPYQVEEIRKPATQGTYIQWETIWQKA